MYEHMTLQTFVHDSSAFDPVDIAVDHDVLYIENHGSSRKMKLKTDKDFLIRWLECNEIYDSWEPYENLRELEQLHAYRY